MDGFKRQLEYGNKMGVFCVKVYENTYFSGMKLIIDIKDHKAIFFLELMNSFKEFVTIEEAGSLEDSVLSREHKAILDVRLAAYKKEPDNLVDWDIFQAELEQGV